MQPQNHQNNFVPNPGSCTWFFGSRKWPLWASLTPSEKQRWKYYLHQRLMPWIQEDNIWKSFINCHAPVCCLFKGNCYRSMPAGAEPFLWCGTATLPTEHCPGKRLLSLDIDEMSAAVRRSLVQISINNENIGGTISSLASKFYSLEAGGAIAFRISVRTWCMHRQGRARFPFSSPSTQAVAFSTDTFPTSSSLASSFPFSRWKWYFTLVIICIL